MYKGGTGVFWKNCCDSAEQPDRGRVALIREPQAHSSEEQGRNAALFSRARSRVGPLSPFHSPNWQLLWKRGVFGAVSLHFPTVCSSAPFSRRTDRSGSSRRTHAPFQLLFMLFFLSFPMFCLSKSLLSLCLRVCFGRQ